MIGKELIGFGGGIARRQVRNYPVMQGDDGRKMGWIKPGQLGHSMTSA